MNLASSCVRNILITTYKTLNGIAPSYLRSLLEERKMAYNLRGTLKLNLPRDTTTSYGFQSFRYVICLFTILALRHLYEILLISSHSKVLSFLSNLNPRFCPPSTCRHAKSRVYLGIELVVSINLLFKVSTSPRETSACANEFHLRHQSKNISTSTWYLWT